MYYYGEICLKSLPVCVVFCKTGNNILIVQQTLSKNEMISLFHLLFLFSLILCFFLLISTPIVYTIRPTTENQIQQLDETTLIYSIIIPTFKEAENIPPLLDRIKNVLETNDLQTITELIFVDDHSEDLTKEIVQEYQVNSTFKVRLIDRIGKSGLSSAVVDGFKEARGKYLLCMDADLQHPPESIILLFNSLQENNCDFSIATRYPSRETLVKFNQPEGNFVNKNWSIFRKIVSAVAHSLSKPLFWKTNSIMTDPMSGFFALEKSLFDKANKIGINCLGFKISLELFIKSGTENNCEIPFQFGIRTKGESKLSTSTIIKYVQHLFSLYQYQFPLLFSTMIQFILILLIALMITVYYLFPARKVIERQIKRSNNKRRSLQQFSRAKL